MTSQMNAHKTFKNISLVFYYESSFWHSLFAFTFVKTIHYEKKLFVCIVILRSVDNENDKDNF